MTCSKPVEWVGSSKADLKRFPDPVQDRMGFAIYQAQAGLRHRDVFARPPRQARFPGTGTEPVNEGLFRQNLADYCENFP